MQIHYRIKCCLSPFFVIIQLLYGASNVTLITLFVRLIIYNSAFASCLVKKEKPLQVANTLPFF